MVHEVVDQLGNVLAPIAQRAPLLALARGALALLGTRVAPSLRGKPILTAEQVEDVVAYLMTLR